MSTKKSKRHSKVKKIAVRKVKQIAPDTHVVEVELEIKNAPELPEEELPAVLDFTVAPKDNGSGWYAWLKHLLW
jgi:hypothetical protein